MPTNIGLSCVWMHSSTRYYCYYCGQEGLQIFDILVPPALYLYRVVRHGSVSAVDEQITGRLAHIHTCHDTASNGVGNISWVETRTNTCSAARALVQ